MSAGARGAGGTAALNSKSRPLEHERLSEMQRDMDDIAAGKLPRRTSGRNATALDVDAYRARISTAAKAA